MQKTGAVILWGLKYIFSFEMFRKRIFKNALTKGKFCCNILVRKHNPQVADLPKNIFIGE